MWLHCSGAKVCWQCTAVCRANSAGSTGSAHNAQAFPACALLQLTYAPKTSCMCNVHALCQVLTCVVVQVCMQLLPVSVRLADDGSVLLPVLQRGLLQGSKEPQRCFAEPHGLNMAETAAGLRWVAGLGTIYGGWLVSSAVEAGMHS